MPWSSDYHFSDPLIDLRSDTETAERLRANLLSELSPGHVLHGIELRVIAIGPADELIVETGSGTVARVHLIWSGRAETPPWPETEMLDSAEQLEGIYNSRE